MDIFKDINLRQINNNIIKFNSGDIVKVLYKVNEKTDNNKAYFQSFEGIVTQRSGSGINKTFTVRKISNGVGVEKNFLLYSPLINKIELIKKNKVRRNKLTYIRNYRNKIIIK